MIWPILSFFAYVRLYYSFSYLSIFEQEKKRAFDETMNISQNFFDRQVEHLHSYY